MTDRIRFRDALRQQRWDDHRFYHHSRINQSLHLFSACCFLASYALLAFDAATAVWIGWLAAWISRQIGHFFFEPKGYDAVNAMTHQEKEDVKIGYNLHRKVVLLAVFLAAPAALYLFPGLFGRLLPAAHLAALVAATARRRPGPLCRARAPRARNQSSTAPGSARGAPPSRARPTPPPPPPRSPQSLAARARPASSLPPGRLLRPLA